MSSYGYNVRFQVPDDMSDLQRQRDRLQKDNTRLTRRNRELVHELRALLLLIDSLDTGCFQEDEVASVWSASKSGWKTLEG